ncbi:hypothetical protein H5398_09405 [Tessaracoccus sp. MC1679]|uniref:hypothetical protein n=1 Tax=Tessaracoccus sp. MC1679 TaxID=2760313 RepID=UPI001602548A|nr:hypothetical protein [Tessaracoccus sp. MC1679]MBB1516181.1 hypothetical protein [Tessaracoccus sp. MC1679]
MDDSAVMAPARRHAWAVAAIGSALLGAAIVAACLLAIRLELTGLGRPRDTAPRLGYLLLLGMGIASSLGIPAWLAWRGLGKWWPIVPAVMILATTATWRVLGV